MDSTTPESVDRSTGVYKKILCLSEADLVDRMHGVMGLANAQRSLNIMRSITEFISQDQYKDVVPMFGVVNEAQTSQIGIDTITSL